MKRALLFLLLCVAARATTHVAATASLADVTTAYNLCSAGDTLQFPAASSATWTTGLTVSIPITIAGQGTTLTASGAGLNHGFFKISNVTSSALLRITGFTFNCVDLTSDRHVVDASDGTVALTALRIDHNTFIQGYVNLEIGGCYGVIDHNAFNNPNVGIYQTAGTRAQADASWVTLAMGTANALFIEDNTFTYDTGFLAGSANESIGAYNGGKMTIRYNSWDSTAASFTTSLDPVMLHGNAAAGAPYGYWEAAPTARRSPSTIEIYNNTVNGKVIAHPFTTRGGSALIYNNVVNVTTFQGYSQIFFYEEESTDAQFSPLRTTWPAEDQVFNTFVWGNSGNAFPVNGVPVALVVATPSGFIQQDRDYFLHAPQSSGGSEVFTGQNGGSNTSPTDGVTYPNLGNMSFTSSGANAYYPYTPYQYPNPLTGTTLNITTANITTLHVQ